MSNGTDAPSTPEHLSALVDGELEGGAVSAACLAWREDSASRATWHAYHLIGDVLRSDDLASKPGRDADFLATLRARMADEPIVLAPMATAAAEVESADLRIEPKRRVGAAANSRWSWMAPSAVAAGFVVVAGVMMVTRSNGPTNPEVASVASPTTARFASVSDTAASALAAPAITAVTETLAPTSVVTMGNRQLIRDARLDRYLSAHKEFAGSTALGVPSGFLRDAVSESPSR